MNEPMRSFDDRSPARTAVQPRAAAPDPLAELARLVGQDDPFRDIFGDAKRAAPPPAAALDDTSWLDVALRPAYSPHETEPQAAAVEPHPAFGYVEPPAYAERDEADDEPASDIPLRKRSGGFLAAGTLLGLAVIGGIGLFAFRDGMSGDAAPGTPPLIRAEPGPNKTVPVVADATDSPQHNKLIYDRVGGEPKAAGKVMSRVEEPVELPAAEPRDASRTLATPAAPELRGGAPEQTGTAPFPNGAEPRRVRTVLIKPDEVANDPSPSAAAPQPAQSATAAARPAAAGTPSAGFERPKGYPFSIVEEEPADTRPPPSAAAPASAGPVPVPASRPPQPATTVVRSPTIAPAEPPRAAAPPQAQRPAPAPQAQTRLAALPPPAQPAPAPPAPTRAAPAASGGGFAVQLTSQRSEQEARTAYAGLQRRFGSVLGPYQPSIQRADLGSRGIFYRVRVAASSREDAVKLCTTLKSQGGECVVQAN